jgi:hypothetical protein
MVTRDDRGELLALWGCHGCHTLNTPGHSACAHCAAPRQHGSAGRLWARLAFGVSAVAALVVVTSSPLARSLSGPSPASANVATLGVVAPPPPPPVTAAITAVITADHAVPRPSIGDAAEVPIVEVMSVTWVNVRSAPTPTAAVLGVIKPNSTAHRLATTRDGWVRLRTDSLVGWVYGAGLTAP